MPNQEQFIQLIRDNEGIIFKITRIYSRDAEDAKDLYQEVVYQLWKSFEKFRGDSKMSTWMYKVALNTALTHSSKRKKNREENPLNEAIYRIYEETDHVMDERIQFLYSQINKMNVMDKGIILLFLEGKSYEEISTITGFTTSNVGTRLTRIKNKLKATVNT